MVDINGALADAAFGGVLVGLVMEHYKAQAEQTKAIEALTEAVREGKDHEGKDHTKGDGKKAKAKGGHGAQGASAGR